VGMELVCTLQSFKAEARMMARLVSEFLLFSCLVAFVTGLVIAAATLFG
jgi:hypothetical protein